MKIHRILEIIQLKNFGVTQRRDLKAVVATSHFYACNSRYRYYSYSALAVQCVQRGKKFTKIISVPFNIRPTFSEIFLFNIFSSSNYRI
jgi:hypothetical protein